MPLIKKVRSRGANMVLVANGELLFLPGGDIARWNRRLSNSVRRAAAREAPSNKRPRWSHYGKPLKQTMRASTDVDTAAMMVHSVVGSTAHYSAFVDQGTGVFAGNGPYPAKILPPWTHGGSGLYEHTWRPGGGKTRVNPVMIKGQEGQGFFDAGVKEGFRAMRIPAGRGTKTLIGKALSLFPDHLENFIGSTPVDGGFIAQLEQWREWRDDAWVAERKARSEAADARYRTKKAATAAAEAALKADAMRAKRAEAKANLEASRAAAARRAKEQAAKLKAQRDRQEEANRIREEKAAQTRAADALMRHNAEMRREAMAFYNEIRRLYPNAQWATPYKLDDGVLLYRVVYTTESGEVVRQSWAYGYYTGP